MTAHAPAASQSAGMSLRKSALPPMPRLDGERDVAPRLDGEDALIWARRVWEERDTWLRARGGVESVFMAAQLMGCREDAVRWLRSRTRL
ncbi:hypothetical protein GCM10028794_22490 [Silanimonas algicola]